MGACVLGVHVPPELKRILLTVYNPTATNSANTEILITEKSKSSVNL